MTDAEYAVVQEQLLAVSGVLWGLDLQGFLARIEHCETLAPVLDPTLYICGARKLERIKRLAVAAREMQRVVEEAAGD